MERLTLDGGATPCHGYVVGGQADGQYLVVLMEPERAVRFYPTELIDRAVVVGGVEPVAGSCPDGVARP